MKISYYDKKKKKNVEEQGFYDLSGKQQIKVTENNIKEVTDISENGVYGIITENNAGTRYVVLINKDGKKVFEPIKGGTDCEYVGDGKFFISYWNEDSSDSYVADEEGNRIFDASHVNKYKDGYTIKDKREYVDGKGMVLTIED